jgi:hypothetical protein
MKKYILLLFILLWILSLSAFAADGYKHFNAAIYVRAYEVREMADLDWLNECFDVMSKYIKVSKVYLETHRDLITVDETTIRNARKFFADRGIETAGGITLTRNESNRFETFCYSKAEDRRKVKEIVEYTARLFDEFILDDFFFTSCKCNECIKNKGRKSWTQYRLELLDDAARNLILGPARAVNPKVKCVIKFPNWYEHFQGLGFNLETEPKIFDGIYTGTETRDAVLSDQHLQPYESYLIFRYLENIKPGGNGGGWVDTGGMGTLDRYAEQLWLTLLAKAPEITLFDFRQMQLPIQENFRAPWQGQQTSFDFDTMIAPVREADGNWPKETTIALAAGYALEKIDAVLGELGNPVGIKSYKPFHSTGEDFIHNYIGMVGIPMDLVPEFPVDEDIIFLAETARFDPKIITRIKEQLLKGKTVIITSGLLRALQGKGIEDIVEMKVTERKAIVKDFLYRRNLIAGEQEILIPQISYLTNDSWEEVSALNGADGWPIFHSAGYAGGKLYILTIPDNFADLYNYPPEVWRSIKQMMMKDIFVRVDGPTGIALFVYDNHTFIVHSFRDAAVDVRIILDSQYSKLHDLVSGEALPISERIKPSLFYGRPFGEDKAVFDTQIKPHSFRAFRGE